jgi:hypothetical protein
MQIVHNSREASVMGERSIWPRFGWAVALGRVITVSGLRPASGQSTWKGAGATLAKPLKTRA